MIRLLLLADPNSSHTIKWVRGLTGKGVKIYLFGINYLDTDAYEGLENVEISTFGYKDDLYRKRAGSISKMKYLRVVRTIKEIIRSFNPDLIHAHFATSYGLIASLLNFHPLIISVWGRFQWIWSP